MNERAKITASHLARQAIVYLRQGDSVKSGITRRTSARPCSYHPGIVQ